MTCRVKAAGRSAIPFLVAMAVAVVGPVVAQDEAPDMNAMMEAAKPGPHHKHLASTAGTWKTSNKMWMEPGQPPMETTGTSVIKSVMDGRFVEEVTKATMMGMPWEGRGVFGYDNTAKKHIGTWYDSFGTMIMTFEGNCEGSCKKISLTGEYFDPMTKSTKKMKTVTVQNSPDKATLTLLDIAKDGTETKMGEIVYMRDKAGHSSR